MMTRVGFRRGPGNARVDGRRRADPAAVAPRFRVDPGRTRPPMHPASGVFSWGRNASEKLFRGETREPHRVIRHRLSRHRFRSDIPHLPSGATHPVRAELSPMIRQAISPRACPSRPWPAPGAPSRPAPGRTGPSRRPAVGASERAPRPARRSRRPGADPSFPRPRRGTGRRPARAPPAGGFEQPVEATTGRSLQGGGPARRSARGGPDAPGSAAIPRPGVSSRRGGAERASPRASSRPRDLGLHRAEQVRCRCGAERFSYAHLCWSVALLGCGALPCLSDFRRTGGNQVNKHKGE